MAKYPSRSQDTSTTRSHSKLIADEERGWGLAFCTLR